MSLFRWVSLSHSITVGFAKLKFTSLIQISNLNPNPGIPWHSLRRELSRLGEPKCLYEEKLSRLPGLLYLPRWDNSSTRVVSPPETTRVHSYKRLFKFYNDTRKSYLAQGNSVGGLSRAPEAMPETAWFCVILKTKIIFHRPFSVYMSAV